jgi:hypothetical protein
MWSWCQVANPNGRKGASFERQVADYWRDNWSEFIDRRVKTGAKDCGDLANVRVRNHRIVIEVKNEARTNLAGWVAEAQQEATNDGALCGIVISKRKGKGNPEDQYVVMTQGDLIRLLAAVTCP